MTGPGLAKTGGVEWWQWRGLDVPEDERDAAAKRLASASGPNDARTFLTGDKMIVAVPEDGCVTLYDCVVRRRGRAVQP